MRTASRARRNFTPRQTLPRRLRARDPVCKRPPSQKSVKCSEDGMSSTTEYGTIPNMGPLRSFSHATLASITPKPSKLALAPLPHSDGNPGRRLGRICRVLQRLARTEGLPAQAQTIVPKSLDLMLKRVAPAKRQEAL